MSSSRRALVAALVAVVAAVATPAAQSQKQSTSSISGRVALDGKSAASIFVTLQPGDWRGNERPVATTTTDREGNYRFGGLAPGSYRVEPYAAGYVFVNPGGETWRPGKLVTIAESESITGIDLTLARGGVITGKVTDATGRSVVSQSLHIERLGEDGKLAPVQLRNYFASVTDDRGVYRLYGIPAGRYLVSIGAGGADGEAAPPGQGVYYPKTYYPSVADASGATIVEVSGGSEAKGIDIVVGRPGRTFRASGRVVEAEGGKPVPGVMLMYGPVVIEDGRESMLSYHSGSQTNPRGEFQLAGLASGRYSVSLASFGERQTDFFADPVTFEVAGADATGIEIRVHPGGSVSGTAVVEGAEDPAAARSALSQLYFSATQTDEGRDGPAIRNSSSQRFESDGKFRLAGLRAGEYQFQVSNWRGPKGYSLLRVERDGADLRERLVLADGEHVAGLRVVIGYGTGAIRGQVKLENGSASETAQVWVTWRRPGEGTWLGNTRVDARRQFLVEGLLPGEYEVSAQLYEPKGGGKPVRATKSASVANGATVELTIVLDLAPGDEGGDR
jgi:hypothetical protein